MLCTSETLKATCARVLVCVKQLHTVNACTVCTLACTRMNAHILARVQHALDCSQLCDGSFVCTAIEVLIKLCLLDESMQASSLNTLQRLQSCHKTEQWIYPLICHVSTFQRVPAYLFRLSSFLRRAWKQRTMDAQPDTAGTSKRQAKGWEKIGDGVVSPETEDALWKRLVTEAKANPGAQAQRRQMRPRATKAVACAAVAAAAKPKTKQRNAAAPSSAPGALEEKKKKQPGADPVGITTVPWHCAHHGSFGESQNYGFGNYGSVQAAWVSEDLPGFEDLTL